MAGNENAATGSRSAADRDRAYGGGWGGGAGGGGGNGGLQKSFGPRYSPTKVRQYDATPMNMAKLLGGTAMGLAAPGIGIGLGPMARDMMGFGFEGYKGMGTGHSYDNKGDFGPSMAAPGMVARPGVGGNPTQYMQQLAMMKAAQRPAAVPPTQAVMPKKPMTSVPGMFLGTGGQYGYGVQRPGYQFFGPGSI